MSIIIALIISPLFSFAHTQPCDITDRSVTTLTDRNGEPVSYLYNGECTSENSNTTQSTADIEDMDELAAMDDLDQTATTSLSNTKKKLISKLLFSYNSAKVKASSQDQLMNAAQQLNNLDYEKVVIRGFADPSGRKVYNKELSMKRAAAVKKWLTQWGIPSEKVTIQAFGEDVARNRKEARRVEISVIQ